MKKLAAKQKRDPHLDWLYNHPDTKMKEAVQRGAVDYIIYNDIDVYAEHKMKFKLKTIKSFVSCNDGRWADIELEHINTSKYHCMKVLNDTLNNFLRNTKKVRKFMGDVVSKEDSSSNEIGVDELEVEAVNAKNNKIGSA